MRSCLACIVPPVLLRELAATASPEDRAALLATLETDNGLRAARAARPRVAHATATADATPGTPRRTIHDCAGAQPQSAPRVVRREGEKDTGDAAADEAYTGLGATYAFYWERFRRDSIDGVGLELSGWVHYGKGYDNAFWDGSEMVFGDGRVFGRFTKALDVIGHELTHGVTEHDAGLRYQGQSGALNESISDVFGIMVKQDALGQTAAQSDWLIGADLVTPRFPGKALRSMKAPGTAWDKDDQPAHMDDYVETDEDDGGVHTNSGIPNKAFCDLALALGGHAWEQAGAIWYATLRDAGLRPTASFQDWADLTHANAQRELGAAAARVVADAWAGVGIRTR